MVGVCDMIVGSMDDIFPPFLGMSCDGDRRVACRERRVKEVRKRKEGRGGGDGGGSREQFVYNIEEKRKRRKCRRRYGMHR